MPTDDMTTGSADLSRWRGPGQLASVLACLGSTILVFSAGQLYFGNAQEFTTPFSTLALSAASLVVALAVLGAGLGRVINGEARSRLVIVLSTLTLLCWVQGTFLMWDYGALDGRPIPWGEMWDRGLLDSAIWIAALAFALSCSLELGPRFLGAACTIVAIQAVALGGLWLASSDTAPPEVSDSAPAAMFDFSPETNILHIVMDGFQSDIFSDILSDGRIPGIEDSLDGFTFFSNHTGGFPYTQLTMPLIVTGKVYQNERPVADFTADVMEQPNVLNAAIDAGFEVDIAAQPALRDVYSQSRHTHAYTIPGNLHAEQSDYFTEDAFRLADLSLFRVAPHFLRFLVHQDELWLLQRLSAPDDYPNLRYFAEIEFLRQLKDRMTVSRQQPTYKLFHLMISHRPTVGTSDCEFDGIKDTSRAAVTEQSVCGLTQVIALIDRMKEFGIYDSALIVLMADHGAWVRPRMRDDAGDFYDGPRSSTVGLAVPLLAIKPPYSQGTLGESYVATHIGDVARTIADLAEFEVDLPGKQVFELKDSERRSRFFYDYAYGDNKKKSGYLYTMMEYRIDGNPFAETAWTRHRRLLPGGEVEQIHAD